MIQIQLPGDLEERLRRDLDDLDQTAKEALLLQAYRDGKVTHHDLSIAFGFSRLQTDEFLKHHNVFEGSLTLEDLEADHKTLERVLGPAR